jgi:hypothetical protein
VRKWSNPIEFEKEVPIWGRKDRRVTFQPLDPAEPEALIAGFLLLDTVTFLQCKLSVYQTSV